MALFIRPYIENIVDIKDDGKCGLWVLTQHMSMHERKSSYNSHSTYSIVE